MQRINSASKVFFKYTSVIAVAVLVSTSVYTPVAHAFPSASSATNGGAVGGTGTNGGAVGGSGTNGGAVGGTGTNGGAVGGEGTNGGAIGSGQTLINPLKFSSLDELINGLLAAVVRIGEYVLLFMLMWTGFKFIAARGNAEKIASARTALIWTIVGGLILLGATAIKLVVQATVTSVTP